MGRSVNADKGQDGHDNDDQADEIDDTVHEGALEIAPPQRLDPKTVPLFVFQSPARGCRFG